MDVSKLLKNVSNLNDYIIVTQEVINKPRNSKIQFNMSTLLALKKIRSLEIEYFNKCDESGAGVRILEFMLQLPPSKTWCLLGKEIVTALLQYWLEAVRKHLILHNNHWWNFLSVLLDFILKIQSKHATISNILVQGLTECMLDLATSSQPDIYQRRKILQCFNTVCAESGREIRLALRNKFGCYFVSLSSILPVCGDIRVQFSILEVLLRWLMPRQDMAVRKEAVALWFPDDLYDEKTRRIFLERPWQNFLKDAREFLNCHNEKSELITTVLCRKFTIGNILLINGTGKDYYLDINSSTECISLIVEPSLSDILGKSESNDVIITKDNTNIIRMYRESSQIFISVNIIDPQLVYPTIVFDNDIQMIIKCKCMKKLDEALRNIFDDKYELLIDLDKSLPNSPDKQGHIEDTGLSKKKTHSGYIVRSTHPVSWMSASTASTSSLAMLRDKLTAFPSYKFDTKREKLRSPQLSCVTEVTEEDRISLLSTSKHRNYGVCQKRFTKAITSDNDTCISRKPHDESSVSCLLVATIGSDESVINETLERLPKDKEIHTDNIVELLEREALQDNIDKSVISDEKNDSSTNIIEGSQPNITNFDINNHFKGILNSLVNKNRFNVKDNIQVENNIVNEIDKNKQTYDVDAVEGFFSQHCVENRNGDLIISPSLAKKINETSSESSLDFDVTTNMIDGANNYDVFNFDDTEVVECLNDMVDKVCEDLDKCSDYLRREIDHFNISVGLKEARAGPLKKVHDNVKKYETPKARHLKLRYNTKARKKETKLVTEPVKRMTTIVERASEVDKTIPNKSSESNNDLSDTETPLIKRKRKLYSPQNENKVNEKTSIHISEAEDDHSMLTAPQNIASTSKSGPVLYKDLEQLRRTSARKLRNTKHRMNLSPKTQKMNEMFDNLKNTTDGGEKIKLADKKASQRKHAVYNFSSDSEDDDFKKKNIIKKKTSSSSVNEKLNKPTRNLRSKANNRNNITKKSYSTQENKQKKEKPVKQKRKQLKNQIQENRNEIMDERMRDAATDILNTSLIVDNRRDSDEKEIESSNYKKPEMEVIDDENYNKITIRKKRSSLSLKMVIGEKASDKDQSARSSPLPGLIIETVDPQERKDGNDSITVTMLEKYKDIYENEQLPDVSEINTTHNLLLELEQVNYDPISNMTEELNTTKQKPKKRSHSNESDSKMAKKSKRLEPQVISILESDGQTERTIETLGKSPITGHGNSDESPPYPALLKQRVEPRGLDTQDLNQSMKNYFDRLTQEIYQECHQLNSKFQDDIQDDIQDIVDKTPVTLNKSYIQSPTVSIKRLSPKEINRWLPSKYNSVFGSNQSSESDAPVRITRSHEQKNATQAETTKSRIETRKSLISPIKMFGEDVEAKSVSAEKDDYLDHIKKLMTRQISKTCTKTESKYNSTPKKPDKTPTVSCSSKNSEEIPSSPIFKLSNKGLGNKFDFVSGSSVSGWLNRNEYLRRNKAESVDLPVKDNLEQILEKLDTSLTEIHHQTSQRFVSMFVDAQKQLEDLRQKRRQLHKETAVNVIKDVVTVIDNNFADLERRSQDLDQGFISSLKENATELMREDCKQKRLMVKMMKEDVQAVLDNIN